MSINLHLAFRYQETLIITSSQLESIWCLKRNKRLLNDLLFCSLVKPSIMHLHLNISRLNNSHFYLLLGKCLMNRCSITQNIISTQTSLDSQENQESTPPNFYTKNIKKLLFLAYQA